MLLFALIFMSVGSYEKENQAEKGHTESSIGLTGWTFARMGFQFWYFVSDEKQKLLVCDEFYFNNVQLKFQRSVC